MKRIYGILLFLALFLLTPVARADGSGGGLQWTGDQCAFADGVLTISGDTVLSGTADSGVRAVINQDASVTLSGVTIASPGGGAALTLNAGKKATVILSGTSILQGAANYAGLEVGYEKNVPLSELTITGSGTLKTTGGANGAGLGGSKSRNGVHGSITIQSGTILATGGNNAAGLGTSDNPANGTSNGSYKYIEDRWGEIVINGGTVTAVGAGSGAGIGGGNHSDSGRIIINGGTVTAEGASGIGCGLGSSRPDSDGKKGPGYYYAEVYINGGNVTASARSGANGAGIGGAMYGDAQVTITGGTVEARGNYQSDNYHHGGAGIGGGYLGHAEVTITGGTINAVGGGAAAGIGSGAAPNSSTDRGSSSRTGEVTCLYTAVAISKGDVTAEGGPKGGAGIGGGVGADRVEVSVSGGTVSAVGGPSSRDENRGGAGIGSAFDASDLSSETRYMVPTQTDISLTGGSVYAVGGWGAAGIGSGAANESAASVTASASCDVTALSDGQKFALDTHPGNASGTRQLANVFRGTFTDVTEDRTYEGLQQVTVGGKRVNLPEGYRSFGRTVTAGTQRVTQSGVRFAAQSMETLTLDALASQASIQDPYQFRVTGTDGYDAYWLYPAVRVKKTWEGAGDQSPVNVQLMLDGAVSRKILLSAPDWQGQYAPVDIRRDGAAMAYSVLETPVPDGYDASYRGDPVEGFEVVNRAPVLPVSVTVRKVWVGADGGAVQLTLYANGRETALQPERNGNTYTYSDLPSTDENGQRIEYTVKEAPMPGYAAKYENSGTYAGKTDAAYDGGAIVNTVLPETVSLVIHKKWVGRNGGAVQLELYVNGVKAAFQPSCSRKGNTYTYTDLPGKDENGGRLVYSVREVPVKGYAVTYENTGEFAGETSAAFDGGTIVNTWIPQTGDDTPLGLWIGLAAGSLALLIGLLLYRRKKNK